MNSNRISAPLFLRFINVAFLIMPGADLVFDMPGTLFGPNDVSRVLLISGNYGALVAFRDGELRRKLSTGASIALVCTIITFSKRSARRTPEALGFLVQRTVALSAFQSPMCGER